MNDPLPTRLHSDVRAWTRFVRHHILHIIVLGGFFGIILDIDHILPDGWARALHLPIVVGLWVVYGGYVTLALRRLRLGRVR